MDDVQVPPQPGKPEQASRLLPLGTLGTFAFVGGVFCMLAIFAFIWLADEVFANAFVTFDDSLILAAHSYWSPTLNQVMLFFTTIAEPLTLTVFIALATFALWRRERWIDAVAVIIAAAGGGLLNQVLKFFFQRTRPDLVQGPFHLTSYSFPSGHSMGAITCYGILAYIAIRLMRRRITKVALALVTGLLVFCVGASRVYFGVHYPTDVLGGFIAGGIWLVVTVLLLQFAEWHAARRASHGSQEPGARSQEER